MLSGSLFKLPCNESLQDFSDSLGTISHHSEYTFGFCLLYKCFLTRLTLGCSGLGRKTVIILSPESLSPGPPPHFAESMDGC